MKLDVLPNPDVIGIRTGGNPWLVAAAVAAVIAVVVIAIVVKRKKK